VAKTQEVEAVTKYYKTNKYTMSGKNGPTKQNAVKCTVYNTVQ